MRGSCTTQKALSHGVDLAKACANSTCFPPEKTTDAKISNWGARRRVGAR